jgi:hypothetical protein
VTTGISVDMINNLRNYARFLGASLDHVIIDALKLVFAKDSEFKVRQVQRRTSAGNRQHLLNPQSRRRRFSHESTGATAIAPQEKQRESIARKARCRGHGEFQGSGSSHMATRKRQTRVTAGAEGTGCPTNSEGVLSRPRGTRSGERSPR